MPDDGSGTPEPGDESPQRRSMPDVRPDQVAAAQDLRATGESILADASRLAALEEDKLALDPDDPHVDRLSEEAIDLVGRLERETRAERQLSDELD